MAIHGMFERHRTVTRALTPVVLATVLLVVLTWALWSAPPRTVETVPTASTTDCHDMVTLSIAGRGDTPRPGTTKMLVDADGHPLPAASADDYVSTWIAQASNAPLQAVTPGSYAAMYIAYPADMSSYEQSVATGVANTESVMRTIRISCPDTKFAIVGYSEGADVARRVAMNVGHQEATADGAYSIVDPAAIVGVVILADAGRVDGQGPFPGAKNPYTNPDGFGTAYQDGRNPVPGQGALPDTGGSDFGALNGKIASFCSDGDLTCAAPQNISLLQLVVNVGRQLNVDALERDQLTPANGIDVATVLSRIALDAFAHIEAQPDWMRGDETFLNVLLTVSDPSYTRPAVTPTPPTTTGVKDVSQKKDSIEAGDLSPLAYLPQKVLKEIVGLIVTNQNTIPVILSDPYQLTLAPDVGHHFDYWRDADPANGKPLTSAEYAAAWLTQLAQQAQAQAGQTTTPSAPATAPTTTTASTTTTTTTSGPTSSTTQPTTQAQATTAPRTTTEAETATAPPAQSSAVTESAGQTTAPATTTKAPASTSAATSTGSTPTPAG